MDTILSPSWCTSDPAPCCCIPLWMSVSWVSLSAAWRWAASAVWPPSCIQLNMFTRVYTCLQNLPSFWSRLPNPDSDSQITTAARVFLQTRWAEKVGKWAVARFMQNSVYTQVKQGPNASSLIHICQISPPLGYGTVSQFDGKPQFQFYG